MTQQCQDDTLYRVFERHAAEYSPDMPSQQQSRYRARLAAQIFRELGVRAGTDEAARHANATWDIIGPPAFDVYPDVVPTLDYLKSQEFRLILVSNWHSGVEHFVAELGIASYFDHVIGSADCGFAKPDCRIFKKASDLLGIVPGQILHVGDSYEADYVGGREAGFRVVLLKRGGGNHAHAERVIRRLSDLKAF